MKLIACVDNNWAIGNNRKLLFNIPEDMKNFRKITTDSGIVVMGRSTYESIGRPLPNRTNIILSSTMEPSDDIIVFNNFNKLLNYLLEDEIRLNNTCIIGGGKIYELFEPYCREALITKVDKAVDKVDTYCPNLSLKDNWGLISRSPTKSYKDLHYFFEEYINFKIK